MNAPKLTLKMSDLTDSTLDALYATRTTVLLVGPPGMGKTSRLEQYEQYSGRPVIVFQGTGRDHTDLAGFPMPIKDEDGSRVTRYTLPPLLTRIRDTGAAEGVIVMDEAPQWEPLLQKAATPLLFERRIGDFQLPDGWNVWMTGNRVQDRAGAGKLFSHTRNRISVVEVEFDIDGWLSWAEQNGVHPMIRAFAAFKPGLFAMEVPSGDDPYLTARSLTLAGNFLANNADGMELPTDRVSRAVTQGFVGAAATELFAFLATHQFLPTAKEIVNNPEGAKCPGRDRPDAAYAALMLAVDVANKNTVDQCAKYIVRLPLEMQVRGMKSLISKHGSGGALLNSPVLRDWTREHKALIQTAA